MTPVATEPTISAMTAHIQLVIIGKTKIPPCPATFNTHGNGNAARPALNRSWKLE